MLNYRFKGPICPADTVIAANTTYSKELDIDGMRGAFSMHIISDADVTINMECSNLADDFTVPAGWTDISHSAGVGLYEIVIPICIKAKINITAGGSDATVSCAIAGA